ncbi:MAG: zf-HC2 domain-containing protein [Planctomycetota bacterium]
MGCEISYEELAAFAAGDCGMPGRSEIEEHLARCDRCRDRLDALRDVDSALGALPRAEPSARAVLEARRALSRELRGGSSPEIMTLDEVAEFLRLTPDQLEEIASGLPAFELAGQIRVRRERLVEWVEQRELVYVRRNIESSVARSLAGDLGRGVA